MQQEIEGPDEDSIKAATIDLGFDWSRAEFGSVDMACRDQYKGMKKTESVGDLLEVRFDMPLPQYFTDRLQA